MRQLKFPTYEYIKSLPKHKREDKDYYYEYTWKLFDTPIDVEGRLSYNLDGDGFIFFDVFEGGYSNMNDMGLVVKFNKANYKKLCKHAQNIFDGFYEALDRDCSIYWRDYLSEVSSEDRP